MEFSIYVGTNTRKNTVVKILENNGYVINRVTRIIHQESAIVIIVKDIEDAKKVCDLIAIDPDSIKITVSEL